jgi:hypothetical protein
MALPNSFEPAKPRSFATGAGLRYHGEPESDFVDLRIPLVNRAN